MPQACTLALTKCVHLHAPAFVRTLWQVNAACLCDKRQRLEIAAHGLQTTIPSTRSSPISGGDISNLSPPHYFDLKP